MKAKHGTRKREHSLNDKSENYSVLGNEKPACVFSKRNLLGSNHLLQQTKKRKLKVKVKTLQEKCIKYEAIKI
jgi:hypothetical protein